MPTSLRGATALFGHLGIEADITRLGDDDTAELAGWIAAAAPPRPGRAGHPGRAGPRRRARADRPGHGPRQVLTAVVVLAEAI